MGQLDYLADFDVHHPCAHTWNAMLMELAKRRLKKINPAGSSSNFIYPFYTTAIPWATMPPPVDPRAWRVDVVSGCVNDVVCSISYKATGDQRGWTMYPAYPFAPGSNAVTIDRPLYDKTNPIPFLTMRTPSVDLSDMQSWLPVNDSARAPFFQTAAMWECSLFVTSVQVSTDPSLAVVFDPSLPAALTRLYRIFVGVPQTSLVTNVQDIARLYLARDPTNNPALDQVFVLQENYWDLQAMIVQAGMNLFSAASTVANMGTTSETSAMASDVSSALTEMAINAGSYMAWWNA